MAHKISLRIQHANSEEKMRLIIDKFKEIVNQVDRLPDSGSALFGLDLCAYLADARRFLMQFAGDQGLIAYANKEAESNLYYVSGFDVQPSFAEILQRITGVISSLVLMNEQYSVHTDTVTFAKTYSIVNYAEVKPAIFALKNCFEV